MQISRLPANTALQRSGWIGPILASKCSKSALLIYQRGSSSRPLNANPFGGS
jgi:hypothetical protein